MLDKAETDYNNQKRAHLPSHSPDKWGLVEGLRDKSEAGTTTRKHLGKWKKVFPT